MKMISDNNIKDEKLKQKIINLLAIEKIKYSLNNFKNINLQKINYPPDSDWLYWRRTTDGKGYSPLKIINTKNVKNRKEKQKNRIKRNMIIWCNFQKKKISILDSLFLNIKTKKNII